MNHEDIPGPHELCRQIAMRRAEQAARERKLPPNDVCLGPLVSSAMDGAEWRGRKAFPSSQLWADEVERIFAFTVVHGQFGTYLPRLRGRWEEFTSALAELRVAYYLDRNRFKVEGWEPSGAQGTKGEFMVAGPSGAPIFVEVKCPRWEGQLSPEERENGRKKQPKYLYCESRTGGSWERVRFEVEKAYKKFCPGKPNLLIIVADELFVSLEHGTDLEMGMALYEKRNDGCFLGSRYENLGGVGAFWTINNGREVWYEMRLYVNANSLTSSAVPEDLRLAFQDRTSPSSQYAKPADNLTPFQHYLRKPSI